MHAIHVQDPFTVNIRTLQHNNPGDETCKFGDRGLINIVKITFQGKKMKAVTESCSQAYSTGAQKLQRAVVRIFESDLTPRPQFVSDVHRGACPHT